MSSIDLNPLLTADELLSEIEQLALSTTLQQRHSDLISKRDAESLSESEYTELIQLTQRAEALDVLCIKYLAKLAQARQVSLTTLLDSFRRADTLLSLSFAMRGMEDEITPEYTEADLKEKYIA